MTSRPFHRMDVDIERNLAIATRWVDLSGVVDLLGDARRGVDPNAAGARAKYGQYTTRGLLIALCEISLSGRELSWGQLAYTLWYTYDEKTRVALGMRGIRDQKALRQIREGAQRGATVGQRRDGNAAKHRVEQRIFEAFDKAAVPIDDTALPGGKRHTNAALKKAIADNPHLLEIGKVREQAINAIIQGSLFAANEERYPDIDPKNLGSGILKDWYGDVAIDETEVDNAIATGRPLSGPNGLRPIAQLAAFYKKNQRLEWPHVLGLTLAITVSRPGKRRVPSVATSGSINHPSAASFVGATAVLDAIEGGGLRPQVRSNRRQYVITDMAYPYLRGWNEALLERTYSAVMKYRKTSHRVHPFTTLNDKTPAGHLFNGVPVCPGLGRKALTELKLDAPRLRLRGSEHSYDPLELHRHDELLNLLRPVTMTRHGRPELTHDRGPGRPRTGVTPKESMVKFRVMCPAAAGTARCPLLPESMQADASLPLVPDPPIDAPPSTCTKSYSTVRISRLQFKDFQEHMSGSWLHEDLYAAARARNEAWHSLLISRTVGNLTRGNAKPNKNAFTSLAVAMAAGSTNLKVMDRWDEVVDLNGGSAPYEPHDKKQRIRRNVLRAYRRHHTGPKDRGHL